ncbi:Cytochrome P450 [Cystobacter fuscus DSM 2262]|uniref:Cytochrome P450 n=1 Tax=Cystobacter fuscus (strain ATCC 25194 / DSM 2262 / NBRC 100088 / M29) TaxID=1242864 RepID=S9PIZ3_CYSF2|nr:cytochrome P450 [Cystobacter fuscus]EPX64275.1 Cytochrome P450 [Cystobacter fuscus DSM 2262]
MTTPQLPSGPRITPVQTFRFLRDATGFFLDCRARYGDPFTVPLPVGNVVITGDPEGIRDIFSADPALFEPLGQLPLAPAVGDHSLLLIAGQRHKRERKLLMPPFHGERMRAYGQLMRDITLRAVETLRPGGPLRAQELTQSISLEVIIRAVFGIEEPERMRRYREVLAGYMESYTPLLMLAVPLRRSFGGLGPWARFQRHVTELDQLLTEELATRRGHEAGHTDILSLLLAARDEEGQPMADVELKDELRTLLIAGHETTAIGMAWALYHLHRAPGTMRRLLEELAPLGPQPEPEALVKLPYLTAVCDEALRLHPVVPVVSRRTLAPFTLRGRELPPGTGVMAAICLAHVDPVLYPEPEHFRPERFLERKYSPFEYLPFGGGARRCIGAAFAQYEMRIVLGSLLAAHRFSLANGTPERPVRRNITIGPARGVEMVYEGPRQGALA